MKTLEKLDARLQSAMDFVNQGTVAADIGTDHGFLICHLVIDGICKRGIATDINEQPLESARELISSLGLEDRIATVLTDGLNGLPETGIDEIIICGMGGDNIVDILSDHDWIRTEMVHLILQPMTKGDTLRKWLLQNGWYIDDEKASEVSGHLYTVISAYFCGGSSDADEMYYLTGELCSDPDESAIKYIRWQSSIQREIASGLMKSSENMDSALEHDALADMLEEEADYLEENL